MPRSGTTPGSEETDDERPSGVILRAAIIGVLFVGGFGFAIPYLTDIKSGTDLGLGPVNGASILALIALAGPACCP